MPLRIHQQPTAAVATDVVARVTRVTSENGVHPQNNFLGAEGLGDVVIRPLLQPADPVFHGAPGRERDDAHTDDARKPEHLEPVDVRKA